MSEIEKVDIPLFKKLLQQKLISQEEFKNIEQRQNDPVSVYWELTTLLYLGIVLLTTGGSIVVYNNIDSIGHNAIVTAIAIGFTSCYAYCFKKAKGYSNKKIETPNTLFDYVLLLGCLLLLTFVAYLQVEYNTFGTDWGLATFVPMVLLFVTAYYFDHLGALSMAITNLAAWAGFTVAPLQIIRSNNFYDEQLIYTALLLGAGLFTIALFSTSRNVKAHFAFTYKNFSAHFLFISLIGAMFYFDDIYPLWFVLLMVAVVFFFFNSLKENSFYFLVITVLYGYVGLSYVVCNLLWRTGESEAVLFLGFVYFITSGVGLIRMLIYYNKIIRNHAHI